MQKEYHNTLDSVEEEFSLTSLEEKIYNWSRKNRSPVYGILELTPLCNMNCDMCYVRLSRSEMEAQGRLRSASEWLSLAEEIKKAGGLFLLLTGGEPLLHPEFRYIYTELQKMGMILTLNTNGTLIDEEWADFFAQHKPRRINITLYGSGADTYEELCHYPAGFEKTLNAIKLLKERNVAVKMNGSLTGKNWHEWKKIIEIGNALDIPVRIDPYMYPAKREREKSLVVQGRRTPEETAQILMGVLRNEMGEEIFQKSVRHELEKIAFSEKKNAMSKEQEWKPRGVTCTAGRCSFTINWQGKMRPCVVMIKPEIDVFEHGFQGSWKYLVEEVDKLFMNIKCSSCTLRTLCQNCVACAIVEEGACDALPEYMCQYTNHIYKLLQKEVKGE